MHWSILYYRGVTQTQASCSIAAFIQFRFTAETLRYRVTTKSLFYFLPC